MRIIWVFLVLAALVLVVFALFGEQFDAQFSVEGSLNWLRAQGRWAGLAALGLLASDLLLPIPATVIFTALGIVFGPWLGGLIGTIGFSLGGWIGYGTCLAFGEKAARWILGQRDFDRGKRLFQDSGGWIVALSRWLPVLPEVISCMAGLTRMPPLRFTIALLCGSAPPAFAFAFLGHAGSENPAIALGVSAIIAPLLWWVIGRRLK
jgi:uncharacterized membrane protein YdjX (TVP38/TMEM64 family)